jgi:hypothetical protein
MRVANRSVLGVDEYRSVPIVYLCIFLRRIRRYPWSVIGLPNYSMDLITYNTNIYFFLLVSLSVWFLRILYSLQLWFFFFFLELLVSFRYFFFFKKNPKISFFLVYLCYVFFAITVVNIFQFMLFFFVLGLKTTNNRYLVDNKNRGMLVQGFETICLYMPIKLATRNDSVLFFCHALLKVASVVLLFVVFNTLV